MDRIQDGNAWRTAGAGDVGASIHRRQLGHCTRSPGSKNGMLSTAGSHTRGGGGGGGGGGWRQRLLRRRGQTPFGMPSTMCTFFD
jgi:hypothetical protein